MEGNQASLGLIGLRKTPETVVTFAGKPFSLICTLAHMYVHFQRSLLMFTNSVLFSLPENF
jgi:hypothetical protein